MCSRCHRLPVSRTWGVTVGSRTYCQACVPRINVCSQHHTTVNEGAQPGNGDDTHNNCVFRCPNYGEGCKWTGELNQLENHLNPQPTTVENLLEGCQFEIINFKWKRYEIKPQAELHTQQLRDFKAVIMCVVLLLLAILVAGGMTVCLHSEIKIMVMNEIELAKSEVEMVKKNPINELQALLVQVQN